MGLSNTLVWWEIGIALGVFLLFLFWDIQSRPKRLRWVRFFALILIISSLLGLYTAPYQASTSKKASLVWVTENANQARVDSLKKSGFLLVEKSSMYDDIRTTKGVEKLAVIGDGLQEWELDQLQNIDAFYPSEKRQEGVIDYVIRDAMEQTVLEVSLQLELAESISLTLSGSGIETVQVESDQDNAMLEVVPTIAGYLTYQLDGIRNGDTIFSETIPLLVNEKRQTNVLILSNSPSFEFRGLKNHFAEAGFGVAERLQVSTDLYHQAFTNISERQLSTVSNRLLDDFQLIVINTSTYDDLTQSEKQRIKTRVESGALGLVLMGGKAPNNLVTWQSKRKEALTFKGENGEVKLTGTEWEINTVSEIQFESNAVAQVKSMGLGKIVCPLFTDSYVLNLQAENKLYARLWQSVLESVVGNIEIPSFIETDDFPRVSEPTMIQLTHEGMEELRVEGVRLATSQQWFSSNTWNTTYWPQQRGWQTAEVDKEEMGRFFTFDSSDWRLQKRQKKQLQTAAFVSQKNASEQRTKKVKMPVSKWIFFGLFLMGITFLWVEQRVG